MLLTAHMDCVEPCEGIKVVKKDGKILSDGTTILGSDDKSGVVAILEAVRMLQETKAEHGDIQVLFTIAEEGGVNGSRCMDKSLLQLMLAMLWTVRAIREKSLRLLRDRTGYILKCTVKLPTADLLLKKASMRFWLQLKL